MAAPHQYRKGQRRHASRDFGNMVTALGTQLLCVVHELVAMDHKVIGFNVGFHRVPVSVTDGAQRKPCPEWT